MEMTQQERTSQRELLYIFHESGMTKREAYLLMMLLANPDNIDILLKCLKRTSERNKKIIYCECLEVLFQYSQKKQTLEKR